MINQMDKVNLLDEVHQDQRSSFLDSEYAKKEEEEDRGIEYTTERTKHQREY